MMAMPTAIGVPGNMVAGRRRMMLGFGLGLIGLMGAPLIALLGLELAVAARCATTTTAHGALPDKIAWRIERKDCAGAPGPYFDVLVGAEGKAASVALMSSGASVPFGVVLLEKQRIGVKIRDVSTHEITPVPVRLRRSGTPAERVDLTTRSPGSTR